tara:strand:- start:76 stop:1269 length:1194 start_codon:yes stop_codon:yes gene_type:complete
MKKIKIIQKTHFLIVMAMICTLALVGCISSNQKNVKNLQSGSASEPIKLIYDGDIGPDPCDFSTISMLHEYHNKGFIELIGVIGETPDPYLASTFSIYNQIYGNDIPIAAYNPESSDVDFGNNVIEKYYESIEKTCYIDQNKSIYRKYGNEKTFRSNDVMGTVTLYRKLLSEAEDNSIVIYAAGQLYNFPPLLMSGADRFSSLSGKELLKTKLKKIVLMAGYFPDSKVNSWYNENTSGAEWNWWAFGSKNTTKTTINALVEMGKPIIYIGAEVGWEVRVGMEMAERLGREHPTTESFYQYKHTAKLNIGKEEDSLVLTSENPAYDEIGLFVAVEGGIGEFFNAIPGRVEVDENGANSWILDDGGGESYITLLPNINQKLSEVITDRITGRFSLKINK